MCFRAALRRETAHTPEQRFAQQKADGKLAAGKALFGINGDEHYRVITLPLAAPEIVRDRKQDYIAYLEPSLRGIRIAKLDWVR